MKYYDYEIENGVLKMVTEGSQGDYPSIVIDTLQLPPVTKDKNGRVVIYLPEK